MASPLGILEHRDSLTGYSDLCREWDKREGDAKRLQMQAREADASLPTGWQGEPGIISGLGFWMPTHCESNARPQWCVTIPSNQPERTTGGQGTLNGKKCWPWPSDLLITVFFS